MITVPLGAYTLNPAHFLWSEDAVMDSTQIIHEGTAQEQKIPTQVKGVNVYMAHAPEDTQPLFLPDLDSAKINYVMDQALNHKLNSDGSSPYMYLTRETNDTPKEG